MARRLAAAILAAMLAAPAFADDATGRWTSRWDAGRGMQVATQTGPNGDVIAEFSCRPPDGELVIADYELGGRGGSSAELRVGEAAYQVSARRERLPGGRALVIALRQSPPVIAGGAQPDAPMSIVAGRTTHTLARGAAHKLRETALLCWSAGQ